jgi:hypothetical protein
LIAEVFALSCLIFNVFITKWIIQHEKADFWAGYAPAVSAFFTGDMSLFQYHSAYMFPTQGKCEFFIYGVGGSIQDRDALCLLPQNVIIEKIFVFIYVWYIVAIIFSVLSVIYLITMLAFSMLRVFDIGQMLERTVTIRECKELSTNADFGIWFTLKIFRRNMVPTQFQNLCKELHNVLKNEGVIKKKFDDDLEKY